MSSVKSLNRAFKVDQHVNYATKPFVIIRFGVAIDKDCSETDGWIKTDDAAAVNEFAEIYTVEKKDVPELVARYSLLGPCSIIFFHKGSVVRRLSTADINKERKNKNFGDFANTIKEDVLNRNIKIS